MKHGLIRLGYLTSHPIQYQAPLFRALANSPGVDFEALFCDMHGAAPSFDPGFGRVVKFDTPLLEGYRHRLLRNRAPRPGVRLTGLFNPEAMAIALSGSFDAIVVHGYSYLTNLAVLGLPRSRRAKLLLRGESHANEPRSGWKLAIKRRVMPALLERADHFLAIGTLSRGYYESYGVHPLRITLAPYSVDNDRFSATSGEAAAKRGDLRRNLGLPEAGPVFLYCAKLTEVKRPRDLLKAFSLSCRGRPAHVAIVGDGALCDELVRLAAELRIERQVTFLGFRNQTELPAIYAAADALVLPSEREPWGLVVNEAMACGLAIAVSDRVGCAPDLVSSNGFVYPVGDCEALARVLRRWIDDPVLLQSMGSRSRTIIKSWGIRETVGGILAGAERAMAQ